MNFFKYQLVLFISLGLMAGISGCSKSHNDPVPPVDPTNPPDSTVALAQFEVMLGGQTTSGSAESRSYAVIPPEMEEFNHPKMAFVSTDYFTFSYRNDAQAAQKAYASTADGKTWTVHEREDANSPVKTILLDLDTPVLSAAYLSPAAIEAGADNDGIVTQAGTGSEILVGCFDALGATAEVTVANNKATAKIPFRHINHLLNFYVRGSINEGFIDHLELDVAFTNAAATQQNAVLLTSSRASYADADGTARTVIQAIVPRNALVKGIRAIKRDHSEITTSEVVSIDCPGGKSHLITLNINDGTMSLQVGSLTDDWVFGGEMNPDGSPVGDIYIATADELRRFSEAVNTNPEKSVAKIDGVLAYTAHVVQTADIDLSSLAWRPIGGNIYDDDEGNTEVTYFAGTYNGNGYRISGMSVTSTTASGHSIASYAGMFGNVQSPTVGYTVLTNIQLTNVSISLQEAIDYSYAGALAGQAYAPSGKKPIVISQCSAQGSIEVNNNGGRVSGGGLVGDAIRAHMTGCATDMSVAITGSTYSEAGGIAGRALDASIASCYAKNTVAGQTNGGTSVAGGIAGFLNSQNEFSHIIACRSDGDVTSNGKDAGAGGITGSCGGSVTGCYAKGNATSTSGNAKFGAIVGMGANGVDLCYGVGNVGAGNSNLIASADNIVYQANPAAGDILSIVSGKAWKDSHGTEMAEATIGGILTTIPINTGGKLIQEVKPRLWVLSDANVWTTASPASSTYPLPVSNYKGE